LINGLQIYSFKFNSIFFWYYYSCEHHIPWRSLKPRHFCNNTVYYYYYTRSYSRWQDTMNMLNIEHGILPHGEKLGLVAAVSYMNYSIWKGRTIICCIYANIWREFLRNSLIWKMARGEGGQHCICVLM